MKEILSKIPDNFYSNELQKAILRLQPNNNNSFIFSLYALLNCELTDASFKAIAETKNEFLAGVQNITYIKNKEIVARWKDFLFLINDKDKINHIQDAVEEYIEVYNQTKETKYLNRALTLIRKVKSIFVNKLSEICEFTIQEIRSQKSSYQQLSLVKTSYFLNPQKIELELQEFFKNQLELSLSKKNYSDAQNHIETLFELKLYSNEEYKIQLALCLESEGDHYSSQKAENTFYPNILTIYIKSFELGI